jgi:hypothetical protein
MPNGWRDDAAMSLTRLLAIFLLMLALVFTFGAMGGSLPLWLPLLLVIVAMLVRLTLSRE